MKALLHYDATGANPEYVAACAVDEHSVDDAIAEADAIAAARRIVPRDESTYTADLTVTQIRTLMRVLGHRTVTIHRDGSVSHD